MKKSPEPLPGGKLPRFLLGDSEDERLFVVHLHNPRFVGEVLEHSDESFDISPIWIDNPPEKELSDALLRDAADFYMKMIEWEDEAEDAY